MPLLTTSLLALAAFVVFFGGVVKGTVGFGYAIASTALLASFLPPTMAVVLMILPMLVANLTLLRELDRSELAGCIGRFWSYILLAMVGTVVGMLLLDAVPTSLLAVGIGVFTLLYVIAKQPWIPIPGEQTITEYCFRTETVAKSILGFVSGLVFGLSNVAVQVVAYLDSLSLSRSTFVGVLALILVGISSLRVALAWTLGMYQSGELLLYSAIVSVPGLLGVGLGNVLRGYIPEAYERAGVLLLLSVIGLRLVSKGL